MDLTERRLLRGTILSIAALLVLRLVAAAWTPLTFDEAYYYADLRIMPRLCVFLRTGAQFRRGMSA